MASQHDPSESAHRLRVKAFVPLFVALLASGSLWNRVTAPHFAGFRPIDALRGLAVVIGLGASATGLWRLFVQRRT